MKDKAFELELSWVGEGSKDLFVLKRKEVNIPHALKSLNVLIKSLISVTKGRHELVPKDIKEEAEKYAKVSPSAVNSGSQVCLKFFFAQSLTSPPPPLLPGFIGGRR